MQNLPEKKSETLQQFTRKKLSFYFRYVRLAHLIQILKWRRLSGFQRPFACMNDPESKQICTRANKLFCIYFLGAKDWTYIYLYLYKPTNLNPLTPMSALTGRDEPWPFFHFWRHHFWPKFLIICAQLLWEKKIFPVMPRSEWSAEWSLRYAQKCSKSGAKNWDQNLLPLHLAAPWWKLPVSMTLS